MKPCVAVTRRLPEVVETELAQDFDVRLNSPDITFEPSRLAALLYEADGILCTVTDRFDGSMLSAGSLRTKILANFGVGYDNIETEAARAAGLVVTNTPDVLTEDTADLAVALMLAVARRVGEGERMVRSGEWHGWGPTQLLGTRVHGKTLGIVGLGRIGHAVARRAAVGFHMRILCHTRHPPDRETLDSLGAEYCADLDDLLARSDFVSVHTPATPETRHLIDSRRFATMRQSAFLINTARGDIVDERALIEALSTRQISGAGLDVYEQEPSIARGLLELDNVVLLPHLGSATVQSRVAMGRRATENLRAFFAGRPPPDLIT
ncbi:MAG: D-glycerate dehydrogenase [Gemmatimonadales bacterium]|nr:D-glycerate dehydrogenase [Gemmatimonadales bacterium]